jgi:hypothetical protein
LLVLQPQLASQLNLTTVALNEQRHYPTMDVLSVMVSELQAKLFRHQMQGRNAWTGNRLRETLSSSSQLIAAEPSMSASKRRLIKRAPAEQESSEVLRNEMIQELLKNFNTRKAYSPVLDREIGECQLLTVTMDMPKLFFKQQVLYPNQLRISFCTNQVHSFCQSISNSSSRN